MKTARLTVLLLLAANVSGSPHAQTTSPPLLAYQDFFVALAPVRAPHFALLAGRPFRCLQLHLDGSRAAVTRSRHGMSVNANRQRR